MGLKPDAFLVEQSSILSPVGQLISTTAGDWAVTDGAVATSGNGVQITRTNSDGGSFTRAWFKLPYSMQNRAIQLRVKGPVGFQRIDFQWGVRADKFIRFASTLPTTAFDRKDVEDTNGVLLTLHGNHMQFGQPSGTWNHLLNFQWLGVDVYNDTTSTAVTITDLKVVKSLGKPGYAALVFDDGYASLITIAEPKMTANSMVGTVFADRDAIGDSGRATIANLQTLQAAGWEIAGHGPISPGLSTMNNTELRAEFQAVQDWQTDNSVTSGINYYSYPGGDSSPNIAGIAGEFFTAARTTSGSVGTGLPISKIERVGTEYNLQWTEVTFDNRIGRLEDLGGLFVFTFHDIVASNSVSTDVETAVFEQFIDDLVTAGINIVKYSELFSLPVSD